MIIPNWNGSLLLKRYLPAVIRELELGHPHSECIVVDDGSDDDSVKLLKNQFPQVLLVTNKANKGFSSTVNAGLSKARHEQVLLINNDVAIVSGFLSNLQQTFEANLDTFAVASLQKQETGHGEVVFDGFNTIRWKRGHLIFANTTQGVLNGKTSRMSYCTAGCSLFSRSKLLELGAFAEIFDPFYYEDAELGLQAAKRGWKLQFASTSVVFHCPGSSSQRKKWSFRFVPVRNYFIMHWLVLDSARYWFQHASWVTFRLVWWSCTGRFRYFTGFLLAVGKLPAIIETRKQRSHAWKLRLADLIE